MWRAKAFSRNEDSDESISEEDDDWAENTISLGGHGNSKGGMQVLSQLEMLKGSHESHQAGAISISYRERIIGSHSEDGVGDDQSICQSAKGVLPRPTMASVPHFNEEHSSDEEKLGPPAFESSKRNSDDTWSEAGREVEALVWLHENSSCSSSRAHGKKSLKGGSRTKTKPKFFIQSRTKDPPVDISDGNDNMPLHHFQMPCETEDAVDGDLNIVMNKSQPNFYEDEHEQPENTMVQYEPTDKHDSKEKSMAEFLDCFFERNGVLEGSSELDEIGRVIPLPVGHEILEEDDDELVEASDSEPPTPNHNENLLLLEYPLSQSNTSRSMADKFHDALETRPAIDERPHFTFPRSSCGGLFDKLQQVVQREKERDKAYLNNLRSKTISTDEKTCISVRIMSRSLEAKLTVCTCSCIGENPYLENKTEMTMKCLRRILTIIFSPRICSDVELEVGCLVRIHAPWKEVHVKGKDEAIILCSYFSQIQI